MTIYLIRVAALILAIGATVWLCWRIPPARPPVFRWLGILSCMALFTEVIGTGMTLAHMNNNLLYNAFNTIEFLFVLKIVHLRIQKWGRVIKWFALIGLSIMVMNGWMYGTVHALFTEGIILMGFLLALVLLFALFHLTQISTIPVQGIPEFWLFVGMLAYFGSLLPLLGAIHFFSELDEQLAHELWTIPPILALVRYGLSILACRLQLRITKRATDGGH